MLVLFINLSACHRAVLGKIEQNISIGHNEQQLIYRIKHYIYTYIHLSELSPNKFVSLFSVLPLNVSRKKLFVMSAELDKFRFCLMLPIISHF